MKMTLLLFAAGLLLAAAPFARAADDLPPAETPEQKTERMAWFREARFGMFVHWGAYAVLGGQYNGKTINGYTEWIQFIGNIDKDSYRAVAKTFNPTAFNADEWAQIAADAGMKYLILTSKHHDGFAMWDSKADDYNIAQFTPFKRDVIKELAEALKKKGIRLGFYYSQNIDWDAQGGPHNHAWDKGSSIPMDEYIEKKVVPQLTELLNDYGEIDVIWWDMPGDEVTRERATRMWQPLRKFPHLITNDRLIPHKLLDPKANPQDQWLWGDLGTPEQSIGGGDNGDFEVCMTINDTWGYRRGDENWKPTETLIRNLSRIASMGGNYLLNVGPDELGRIPAGSVDRLREMGEWLKTNGEAVYGTKAGVLRREWTPGVTTLKGQTLYVHLSEWPEDGVLLVPVEADRIVSAKLLADPSRKIDIRQHPGGFDLTLPGDAPDARVSVIAVAFEGTAKEAPFIAKGNKLGVISLTAAKADLTGPKLGRERQPDGTVNLGNWTDVAAYPEWQFEVPEAGRYLVDLNYAVPGGSANTPFELALADQKLAAKAENTGGWVKWKNLRLGEVDLPAGLHKASLKATGKTPMAVMNMTGVRLIPAAALEEVEAMDKRMDTKVVLSAEQVRFEGPGAKVEGGAEKNIGGWTNQATKLLWDVEIPFDGLYDVTLEYGVPDWADGSTVRVAVGGEDVKNVVPATGGFDKYAARSFGAVKLKAGPAKVVVDVLQKPKGSGVMNLRRITLQPKSQD